MSAPSFVLFTLLAVAGPIGWLAYNQHFFHDPLDFIRGPYSAAAIEKRTSPPGSEHYRGWHSPVWALCLLHAYGAGGRGFLGDGLSRDGGCDWRAGVAIRRRLALPALLLWVPLPFYVYSVAYGSVPIFIPQLWPHSYYNSRYGMEMLPAFAVFALLAVQWVEGRWSESQPLAKRLMQPIVLLLIVFNTVGMMYRDSACSQGGDY